MSNHCAVLTPNVDDISDDHENFLQGRRKVASEFLPKKAWESRKYNKYVVDSKKVKKLFHQYLGYPTSGIQKFLQSEKTNRTKHLLN